MPRQRHCWNRAAMLASGVDLPARLALGQCWQAPGLANQKAVIGLCNIHHGPHSRSPRSEAMASCRSISLSASALRSLFAYAASKSAARPWRSACRQVAGAGGMCACEQGGGVLAGGGGARWQATCAARAGLPRQDWPAAILIKLERRGKQAGGGAPAANAAAATPRCATAAAPACTRACGVYVVCVALAACVPAGRWRPHLGGEVHDPFGLVLALLEPLQAGALVVEVVDGKPA